MEFPTSSKAPVSDRLRIVHSTMPRANEIVPPLKVRCLELSLFSSMDSLLHPSVELGKANREPHREPYCAYVAAL